MKLISTRLVLLAFYLTVFFTSCGSGDLNKKAEATAIDFYKKLQNKDYKAAIDLCSDKAFATDSKADWSTALEKNAILLGDMKSFTKISSFNIATSTTTGTTVAVAYNVAWQYGKTTDSLILVKEKDGSMKVFHYEWVYVNPKFMTEVNESEKVTDQYMAAIKAGNADAATTFCSEEALKITPKDKWITFLNSANSKLGNVADYKIIKDSSMYHIGSTGDAGKGNYYDVFVQSDRGRNKVMEKIIFFQKNYDTPVKVTGHYFL